MLDFPRWKIWAVSLTIAFGILLAIPSLMPARMVRLTSQTFQRGKSSISRWPA